MNNYFNSNAKSFIQGLIIYRSSKESNLFMFRFLFNNTHFLLIYTLKKISFN